MGAGTVVLEAGATVSGGLIGASDLLRRSEYFSVWPTMKSSWRSRAFFLFSSSRDCCLYWTTCMQETVNNQRLGKSGPLSWGCPGGFTGGKMLPLCVHVLQKAELQDYLLHAAPKRSHFLGNGGGHSSDLGMLVSFGLFLFLPQLVMVSHHHSHHLARHNNNSKMWRALFYSALLWDKDLQLTFLATPLFHRLSWAKSAESHCISSHRYSQWTLGRCGSVSRVRRFMDQKPSRFSAWVRCSMSASCRIQQVYRCISSSSILFLYNVLSTMISIINIINTILLITILPSLHIISIKIIIIILLSI